MCCAKVPGQPLYTVIEPAIVGLVHGGKMGNDIKREYEDMGKKHGFNAGEEAGGWGTPPSNWERAGQSDWQIPINRYGKPVLCTRVWARPQLAVNDRALTALTIVSHCQCPCTQMVLEYNGHFNLPVQYKIHVQSLVIVSVPVQ